MSIRAAYLIKNSLFSVLQVIIACLSFALIYYQIISNLGKAQLGVWSVISSIPMAAAVFGSGVSGCILRYVPIYISKDDGKAFSEILWNGVVFNLLLGITILVIGYLFSTPILAFLFSSDSLPHYLIILFRVSLTTFLINLVTSVLLNALDGLLLTHTKNQFLIIGSLVLSVFVILFLKPLGLKCLFYAQLLQSVSILLLATYKLITNSAFDSKYLCLSSKCFKIFLTFGKGFHIISFSVLLFEPVSRYFLIRYFNLEAVGTYEFVNRLILQVRTLIVNTVQIIIPVVTRGNAKGDLDLISVYQLSKRSAILVSLSIFVTLICYGLTFIAFYDSDRFKVYYSMIMLLGIAYLINIMASTAYAIFLGLGKLKHVIISHVISTGLSFLLFFLFGSFLSNTFMILPVALSVGISSVYLLLQFRKEMHIANMTVIYQDVKIYVVCFVSILTISTFALFNFNGYILVGISILHTVLLIYYLLINNFITRIFNMIRFQL